MYCSVEYLIKINSCEFYVSNEHDDELITCVMTSANWISVWAEHLLPVGTTEDSYHDKSIAKKCIYIFLVEGGIKKQRMNFFTNWTKRDEKDGQNQWRA